MNLSTFCDALSRSVLASLAAGFDQLVALAPHELQLGLLKRLRGTPIVRHTERYAMRYAKSAPYEVIATAAIDAETMQRIGRFARYWDRVANSGRFHRVLPLLLGDAPFDRFMAFSDWLHGRTRLSHSIALEELYGEVHAWLLLQGAEPGVALSALTQDYRASGARGRLPFAAPAARREATLSSSSVTPERQRRHLRVVR